MILMTPIFHQRLHQSTRCGLCLRENIRYETSSTQCLQVNVARFQLCDLRESNYTIETRWTTAAMQWRGMDELWDFFFFLV